VEPEHIDELAHTMCKEDAAECWAAGHRKPYEALARSVKLSPGSLTGLADGQVGCIFGVGAASILTGVGSPWMLGSPVLQYHAKVFLRANKVWLADEQLRWDKLINFVDIRHRRAVRWLDWLGFTLFDPAPYGPDSMMFHKFVWERDNV
jgi:hypothetical protein